MKINILSLFVILYILNSSFLIPNSSIAYAIEVGGHLTEDITWSPDNNPYLVTSGIYVDADVTLTVNPGTIVKFNSDFYDDIGDDQFYFHNGEEPIAKFIRVEGRIIAEGTEQDSIIFTRMQDEEYYHWGSIYLPEGSEQSSFKHCVFKFSAFTGFSISEQPRAALAIWNGSAKVEECCFIDNDRAVSIEKNVIDILLKSSNFDYDEYFHPNIMNNCGNSFIMIRYIFGIDEGKPLITENTFIHGKALHTSKSVLFVSNNIDLVPFNRVATNIACEYGESYCFDNYFGSCSKGIDAGMNETESIYIRGNHFDTNGGYGIDIDDAYVEISNNYFEECEINSGINNTGKVYNNYSINGSIRVPGFLEVFNNISVYGNSIGIEASWRNISCYNNLALYNEYAIGSGGTLTYNNNIIIMSNELNNYPLSGNPIFRNCIIDFELAYPLIDGGGNIIVDSLQAQSIFEDIQNGDFHLTSGSIAIDAGLDTLGYCYPFDLDFNHRIWDGDNNGSAIIDIGPYEYGAPALGGIEGITYDPITGLSVDYVLIKINNIAGEFTFSDSIGNYEYKLPAGVYDIYAERVFYDDATEYQIEVFDGEFSTLDIPMCETVNVQNYEIIPPKNDFNLCNYPNPFNPETTLVFSIQNDSDVELTIFNIKGQRIATLINEKMQKGKHSIIWSGCDQHGNQVSSGIYFYKLKVGNQESVKRMLLLK
ncbi:MAG TPA: T9SS type A sorting domain-containing protein [Candidatus Cloacimonadota bacterium]|nr:T9SS type A sorting domain-containing protein [Candidatus Cloacimonadota bacterium]